MLLLKFLKSLCLLLLITLFTLLRSTASPQAELDAVNAETMRPFEGRAVPAVDTSTLTGKVMCGYQGWFNAEGDGAGRAWHHWTWDEARPAPGNAKVDLWPDVSELGPDERFPTDLRHADGRVAEVFSSYTQPTVLRHLRLGHLSAPSLEQRGRVTRW